LGIQVLGQVLGLKKFVGIVLCLFLTLALFVSVPKVYGLDSIKSPGTVVSVQVGVNDRVWNNPNNVKVSDDQYASSIIDTAERYSERLVATNFGFSLPNNAIILGIETSIECHRESTDVNVIDNSVNIIKSDGSLGSENKASLVNWPLSDGTRFYGGSSDLWSETWNAADINDPDFGIAIRVFIEPTTSTVYEGAYIDLIRITVYYTPPRPILQSAWTDKAPKIDGLSSSSEWYNLVIFMQPPNYPIEAYVYMMNDNNWLYVLVDAVGDTTDDAADECLLMFEYGSFISINIIGASGTTISNNYRAAVGYGPSPHSSGNHKIYEFKIPLSYVGLVPGGGSVDFCSPEEAKGGPSIVFDESTGLDNIYPYWLEMGEENTWGLLFASLRTAGPAVGGYYMETNRFTILAPYVMLAVGLLGLGYAIKRKH